MSELTVIVGAGIAGVSAAAALRKADREREIMLIGDEPELPYRRPPVSKEVIRGEKDADEIRIKKAEWYASQGIRLHTGTRVAAISTETQEVTLANGSEVAYGQLLLATGGRARLLGSAGIWNAHTLRYLADVPPLTAKLNPGTSVAVVGAGLIGSEIAASLRQLGCRVVLLETAALPMPKLLPPELGQMYVELHKSQGVDLHTHVNVEAIEESDEGIFVRAQDGRTWAASVAVVAVGMEPNIELARAAGIEIASREDGGGILVDLQGRTSAPHVFAAGDVANLPHAMLGGRHRVEHWQHAQNHGTSVGKNMAGIDAEFLEIPWCWSDQYEHNLQITGWPHAGHELHVRGSLASYDFTAFFLEDGVLRGAVTIGRPREIRTARQWIAASTRLDVTKLADDDLPLGECVLS